MESREVALRGKAAQLRGRRERNEEEAEVDGEEADSSARFAAAIALATELAETVTTALAAAQLVRGCICRLPRCRLGIAVSHPSTLYWASTHRPNYDMIIGCTYWATFRPNIFWGDLFFLSHHRLCIVCSVLMLSNAALFVSWDFLIAK